MLIENLQINPDALPQAGLLDYNAHPRRYLLLRIISRLVFLGVIMAIVDIQLAFQGLSLFLWGLGAWLLLSVLLVLVEVRAFHIRGYALRQRDITYQKGWIFYTRATIPFERIQHTELHQGPLDRLFELTTLRIYTAGGSASDMSIPGLEPDEATRLLEFISARTAEARGGSERIPPPEPQRPASGQVSDPNTSPSIEAPEAPTRDTANP